MGEENISVVAYLPGELGRFVDNLRNRLNPRFAAWLAHVTILPPRPLSATSEAMLAQAREKCLLVEPFEASLDGVLTFGPANGVVYLSFAAGFGRFLELHEQLNCGCLERAETYPYVPHVTLAQELDETGTQAVLREAAQEWAAYKGDMSFRVDSLSLVRQAPDKRWIDLAPIPLGSLLKPARQ